MSEYVWAIDVAMAHLAFAFADVDSERVEVETLITRTVEREGARLGLLDRQVRIYARQAAGRYPPACAWVEQPSGRFPNPQLYYAVGVIQAALFETLACPVWSLPSGKWKRQTVGVGNATKKQVRAWVNGRQLRADTQDEADAVCMAVAGRRMLMSRSWEPSAA